MCWIVPPQSTHGIHVEDYNVALLLSQYILLFHTPANVISATCLHKSLMNSTYNLKQVLTMCAYENWHDTAQGV